MYVKGGSKTAKSRRLGGFVEPLESIPLPPAKLDPPPPPNHHVAAAAPSRFFVDDTLRNVLEGSSPLLYTVPVELYRAAAAKAAFPANSSTVWPSRKTPN